MQRLQELFYLVVVWCALVALVLTAPVNKDNNGGSVNTAEVKESPKQTSPEDELKALSTSDAVVANAPEAVAEEQVEDEAEDEALEQQLGGGANMRSDLPLDTNMFQAEQSEPEQILPEAGDSLLMPDTQLVGETPQLPALDLSPKTVAEYLLLTGDWESFDQATADLLQAGILMPAEAGQYREDVALEYEHLMREVADAEATYLQETAADPFETSYDLPMDLETRPLPSAEVLDDLSLTEELRRLELEELLEKEAALDELLEAIVEDYVDRAQQDEEREEAEEALQQEVLPNAHYVQVLDVMANAVEGEIATDDDLKETGSDVAEVKDVPETNEVEELESLGKLQNATGPKKVEQNVEKESANESIQEPSP